MIHYFLIIPVIIFGVVGQLLIKYGVSSLGEVTFSIKDLFFFLTKAITNIYVIGGLGISFVGTGFWFIMLNRTPLSRAYPFLALSFVLVYFLSGYVFHEPTSWLGWVGIALIFLGIYFITKVNN